MSYPLDSYIVDSDLYSDETSRKQFHVDYLKDTFRDFARSNLFKVEIFLPKELQAKSNFMSISKTNMVEMSAKTANIAAFDMGKYEIKRMGQRIILPSITNTGECQLTFMSDDNYTQRKLLHSWLNSLVYNTDYNTYKQVMWLEQCKMRIYQLDNKFNVIFGIQLNHCWPSSIGEIQLSQDSENQITEFPATFAYSTYNILTTEMDFING